MSAIDVDQIAFPIEFAVEQGNESTGHPAAMDDAVQAAGRGGDLFVFGLTHAHADDHVPGLKRGRQAVTRGVGDDDDKGVLVEGYDVVEISADDLGGDAARRQLEIARPGQVPGQNRRLNASCVLDNGHHLFFAQFLVDGDALVAQDAGGTHGLLGADARGKDGQIGAVGELACLVEHEGFR